MMSYALIKVIHVLSMSLFFGAGLASAIMKLRADRTKDVGIILFALRHIVWADWLFTVPSGIVLPLSGLWMAQQSGLPLTHDWIAAGIVLYAIAGVCWVPAAILQVRMRRAANAAFVANTALAPEYWRWTLWWAALGVPAFFAALLTVYIMVAKPALF